MVLAAADVDDTDRVAGTLGLQRSPQVLEAVDGLMAHADQHIPALESRPSGGSVGQHRNDPRGRPSSTASTSTPRLGSTKQLRPPRATLSLSPPPPLAQDRLRADGRVFVELKTVSRWHVSLPLRAPYIGGRIDRGAPCYGEDNDYVYGELLGMSSAEIKGLAEEGVI